MADLPLHPHRSSDQHQDQDSSPSHPSLDRKRAAMLQRLAAIHDSRLQQLSARQEETAAESFPLESTQEFLRLFSGYREQAQQALASFRERKGFLLTEDDKSSLKHRLETVALDVSDMEKFVADKSYFLPAYEVRVCQSAIVKLREDIETTTADLLPKKKFSFRAKPAQAGKDLEKKREEMQRTMPCSRDENETREVSVLGERITPDTTQGIRDVRDSVIVKDLKDQEDAEYVLSNLSNCRVYLRGKLKALFIHKLNDSHIYAGPVTGSVHIEEVENCVLMLASHQIRIHSSKFTDFYLRIRSRPIVEHTSGVRFSNYKFGYDGIQDDLKAANLSEETGMWANVDDFRWLRAVPSPNWSILPEDQRLPFVDGSDFIADRN